MCFGKFNTKGAQLRIRDIRALWWWIHRISTISMRWLFEQIVSEDGQGNKFCWIWHPAQSFLISKQVARIMSPYQLAQAFQARHLPARNELWRIPCLHYSHSVSLGIVVVHLMAFNIRWKQGLVGALLVHWWMCSFILALFLVIHKMKAQHASSATSVTSFPWTASPFSVCWAPLPQH